MRLIVPYYQIITELNGIDILLNLERIGRTAYKSEGLIRPGSAERFIRKIVHELKHESVIEHESFSVKFICDRGVSHELVRHRLASYTQESTRYCNYGKNKFGNQITFIIPAWFSRGDALRLIEKQGISPLDNKSAFDKIATDSYMWATMMQQAENGYFILGAVPGPNWTPEKARSILPNSLKTEITMTANLREWRHFFKLRTHQAAHPQMRELAVPLLNELKEKVPVIFEDIKPAKIYD